jgi:cytochrome c biogenesis protein CcmG/thiol:disulfide interchange protein DsbE
MRQKVLMYLTIGVTFFVSIATSNADSAAKTACPNFTLYTIGGELFTLSRNLGRGPIIIAFWATWCSPCAMEMKKINELYRTLKSRGLQVLAVSIDDPRTLGKVAGFVRKHKLPFTMLLDPNHELMAARLQLQSVPHLLLLDKDGKIVWQHSGFRPGDELELQTRIEGVLAAEEAETPSDR